MGKQTGSLDALINLFTRKNERHNRALRELTDLSKAIEEFLVKYSLQDKSSNLRLVFKNVEQARIDVTTITYRTMARLKMAKDINSKRLLPLLEQVHSDLETLKRAIFTSTVGSAVISKAASQLYKSFTQFSNEISNIDHE